VIFCAACAEAQRSPGPPPAARPDAPSPGLAFVFGLIPGVGAIYNGQYAKGIVHVLVFGLLITIVSSGSAHGWEPLFGLLIAVWFFYMALEAYHTAKRRAAGEAVDEFSGLFQVQSGTSRAAAGPLALIVLGVIFLLHSFNLVSLEQIVRFWPVGLIAAGGYMLYHRLSAGASRNGPAGDAGTEAQP
jgi:TM2 domain-containing membrane protein YozV